MSPFPVYFVKHYYQSLQRIRALQPTHILMAHGGRRVISDAEWESILQHAPAYRRTVADTIKHKLSWRAQGNHVVDDGPDG